MIRRPYSLLVWAAAVASCLALPTSAQSPEAVIEDATPGLKFRRPVNVEVAPGEGNRLYVVEKGINAFPARIVTAVAGDTESTVFLDLTDQTNAEGEAGLLGLAFHPDYAANGRVFVYYTASVPDPVPDVRVFVSRLSEFARSSDDPLQADPASERVLLEVDQPSDWHNGGTIDFGDDGYLYFGLGDGGGADDGYGNGQDPTTLLGSILRIDVDDVPEGATYGIPDGNPFAGAGGPERPEVFAYGFRNPFKFDVGPFGVWVGDVGQGHWEEINQVEAGGNYGWSAMEGPDCFPAGSECDPDAFEAPLFAYPHGADTGESITGGFVIDAPDHPWYRSYLFADFVSGRLWRLPIEGGTPTLLFDTFPFASGGEGPINIVSIDRDADAEVLVTDYFGGKVYRLSTMETAAQDVPADPTLLSLRGPNPFRNRTALVVEARGTVRVVLLDVLGREVAVLWDGPAPAAPLAIDGAALSPGAYAVVATSSEGRSVTRLVRTH